MGITRRVRAAILAAVGAFVVAGVSGQPQEPPLAAEQQAELARDLLSGDPQRRDPAVSVAAALGPVRMSEAVRSALITLLEQLNALAESARRGGAATATVVDPEFMMTVAGTVADLRDVRAIRPLARVAHIGYSQHVTQGLASFGEQAVPAIVAVTEEPSVSGGAVANSLRTLSRIVADAAPNGLTRDARISIIAVTQRSLAGRDLLSVLGAADLAVALDEPEFLRAVRGFVDAPNELRTRGLRDAEIAAIQARATQILAR